MVWIADFGFGFGFIIIIVVVVVVVEIAIAIPMIPPTIGLPRRDPCCPRSRRSSHPKLISVVVLAFAFVFAFVFVLPPQLPRREPSLSIGQRPGWDGATSFPDPCVFGSLFRNPVLRRRRRRSRARANGTLRCRRYRYRYCCSWLCRWLSVCWFGGPIVPRRLSLGSSDRRRRFSVASSTGSFAKRSSLNWLLLLLLLLLLLFLWPWIGSRSAIPERNRGPFGIGRQPPW
mmetsp:Transcript_8679/g.25665  ORF Transcript_8679/g.25665 Transcript_8679/m.25665 type:complete len:230 (-) Transcript_8679:760-1449(-)